MHQSSKISFDERSVEPETSREFLLQLIRLKISAYPLTIRALFELSFYSPISSQELINLNKSDIDVVMRTVKVKRGDEILYIPITEKCATSLKELCSSIKQTDAPLFLNRDGERINLSNLWFIKNKFSIDTDDYLLGRFE